MALSRFASWVAWGPVCLTGAGSKGICCPCLGGVKFIGVNIPGARGNLGSGVIGLTVAYSTCIGNSGMLGILNLGGLKIPPCLCGCLIELRNTDDLSKGEEFLIP